MNFPRPTRRLWLASAALFLLAAIAFMPLRWILGVALSEKGAISASGADGTIWSGSVFDVTMGNVQAGTFRVGFQPFGLLLGRLGFWFEQPSTAGIAGFRGSVARGFSSASAQALEGELPVADLLPGIPSGKLKLENVSFTWSANKCSAASGNVRLEPDGALFNSLGLQLKMMGRIRCENGMLLVPLTSESAMEKLDLRIKGDGQYSATAYFQQPAAELAPLLSLAGFAPVAGGFRKVGKGRFW
jgi:general secretion pathway protein N